MQFGDLYANEFEERERIRKAESIAIGVLAVLGGLLGTMAKDAWFSIDLLSLFFLPLAGFAVVYFLAALYFIFACYQGHTYKVLPTPLDLKGYRDSLRIWHTDYGEGSQDADQEFATWLEDSHALAADINSQTNFARAKSLSRANKALTYCAAFAITAFVPFAIHQRSKESSPQKVEIVNLPTGAPNMANEEKPSSPAAQPVTQPQPAPQPPPKPQPPQLRTLKEGEVPKTKNLSK